MGKVYYFLSHILAISILSITIFFSSCQKKIDDTGGGNGINDSEMVTGGVTGIVIDENNLPVAGATVTSGSATTTTDRYGSFKLLNISLSKTNGTVKVNRPGYFNAYRTFVSVEGRINSIRIKLIPKVNSGSFSAASGGTVTIPGGGKLVMSPNSVTDAGGVAYTGMVNVSMTWIDPSSDDLPYLVMGDLRGITTTNEERGLSTYGMLGVELTGNSSQPLKIAEGKTAELTFPVPASLLSSAPATIDLWHFDETTARWKQEGTATKTGNNYIANVAHFTFWNCDAPFEVINLCMSLKDGNGQPIANAQVRIRRIVNNTFGYGLTDMNGNVCGQVPKNEALILEVLNLCHEVIYSQNIGPFTVNTTLSPIIDIPVVNSLTITGTIINCAGGNVTNGAAIINASGGNHYYIPVTNGVFSITIPRCSSGSFIFTVVGVDNSAILQSAPINAAGTTGIVNVGTIQACGTSALQFVEFIVDGNPYILVSPPDFITSHDSIGTWGTYNSKRTINSLRSPPVLVPSRFSFPNNMQATTVPLTDVVLNITASLTSQQVLTPNPTVTITNYGPPGGLIEGNFNVQMMFGAVPRNVICNFSVRRN